jgi:hypothetical protein
MQVAESLLTLNVGSLDGVWNAAPGLIDWDWIVLPNLLNFYL